MVKTLAKYKKKLLINPLTAGNDYIRFLHFLSACCLLAFKQVEDIQ